MNSYNRWLFTNLINQSNNGLVGCENELDNICIRNYIVYVGWFLVVWSFIWQAVDARDWQNCKEGKQAEFLLEKRFPWHLVESIGVCNRAVYQQVSHTLEKSEHRPELNIKTDWYY